MTSYTPKGNYPYPAPTDAVTDYPAVASTFAGYVDNLPNRNAIINPLFTFWQRGQALGTLATGSYTADRWRLDYDGTGGTRIVTASGVSAGITIGGMQPRYVANITLTNAGTSTSQRFAQRIEDVRTFAGETVTLSFWCLSTVAAKTITAKAVQNFGTGGSPSAAVTTTIGSVTTTTSMVRRSFTFTVPALTSKTIGSAEDSYLEIHFDFGSQTGTFQIWGVQLEQNSTATALERRPMQQELALCQRYFERITAGTIDSPFASGVMFNTTTFLGTIHFQPKRASGTGITVSVSSTAANQFEIVTNGSVLNTTASSVGASDCTNSTAQVNAGCAATVANGGAFLRSGSGVLAYFDFSAEL